MEKTKPVKTIRMGGIEASIWENENDGRKTYSVTFKLNHSEMTHKELKVWLRYRS